VLYFVQGDSIKYFLDSVERIGQMVCVIFTFNQLFVISANIGMLNGFSGTQVLKSYLIPGISLPEIILGVTANGRQPFAAN